MKQLLPIGKSDFRSVIENDYYFVDKSLLIKDVIDSADVLLITRPRRFGKTINLSMLRYFYSNEADNSQLFSRLAISQAGERYMSKQGKHPVIFLTFKDIKSPRWEEAYKRITYLIQRSFMKDFGYLLDSNELNSFERNALNTIVSGTAEQVHYANYLTNLSQILERIYQQKVVILIDEYDTPIHTAYTNGYYDKMIDFMRDFLSGGLKDNDSLEKGVITGIMRVAKESIFSGLNNLGDFSILSHRLAEYFGFTEAEVSKLVQDMGMHTDILQSIQKWYNGYVMGNQVLYNPWSIIQYISNITEGFKPYWINTSSNLLLRQLFFTGKTNIRQDLEKLIRGGSLRKEIAENLVFQELTFKHEAVWSLLLAAGYLKAEQMQMIETSGARTYKVSIPNKEVNYVYRQSVNSWLSEQNGTENIGYLLEALTQGEVARFEHYLQRFAETIFSFHDTKGPEPESFYHAFILGLLVWLESRYHIRSNRESGKGRFDIALTPKDSKQKGIIIEIKSPYLEKDKSLQDALKDAAEQLNTRNYAHEMRQQGILDILQLAVAVHGKDLLVKEVA